MSTQDLAITRPPRSAAVDAVRNVGIIAIVAGHVWSTPIVRDLTFTWHVPVFFFLSGYLWKFGRSERAELQGRTQTLLVPHVAWLVIVLAVAWPTWFAEGRRELGLFVGPLYGGSWVGYPFPAFWFLTALFFASLMYRAMDNVPLWGKWAIGAICATIAFYAPGQPVRYLPFGIGLALPGLLFMTIGETVRRYRSRMGSGGWLGLALLAISAILVASGLSRPIDLKLLDPGTPVLSVAVAATISTGLLITAEAFVPSLGLRWATIMIGLARALVVVVVAHGVVFWAFGQKANVITFACTLILPWVRGLLLVRIPGAWFLTGVVRPRTPKAPPA